MHSKILQKEQFKKYRKETGDLIGNKIGDKITKVSRTSRQNNSDKVTNSEENIRFVREIPTKT